MVVRKNWPPEPKAAGTNPAGRANFIRGLRPSTPLHALSRGPQCPLRSRGSLAARSFARVLFLCTYPRCASPLELPYTLSRGGPNAPLRSRGSLAAARSLVSFFCVLVRGGASPLELPYTLARGDPSAPLRLVRRSAQREGGPGPSFGSPPRSSSPIPKEPESPGPSPQSRLGHLPPTPLHAAEGAALSFRRCYTPGRTSFASFSIIAACTFEG